MNKLDVYQRNGLVGLNYFIKAIRENNKEYYKIVKLFSKEVRLWCLITLFQNNHELVKEDMAPFNLRKLFLMEPITRNTTDYLYDDGSFYDYGIGIKTNSNLDYETQFRYIRNNIAHNNFIINEDGLIVIDDHDTNYNIIMDPKWFEAAIMCLLSNKNYTIRSGLSESFAVSYVNNDSNKIENIIDGLNNKTIGVIHVNLKTNSLEKVCRVLEIVYNEELEFQTLYYYITNIYHELINKLTQGKNSLETSEYFALINKCINELNKVFEGAIVLEYEPISMEVSKTVINNPEFERLESYRDQIYTLFNHYQMTNVREINNTLSFKTIMDMLYFIDNNMEISPKYKIYLDDAFNLLVKSMGNLVFNSIMGQRSGFKVFSDKIFDKYKSLIEYDYGHARKYYKECLKKYENTIKDVTTYGRPNRNYDPLNMKLRTEAVRAKLKAIEEGDNPEIFLGQMRNIFAHGFLDVNYENAILYDQDINRYYYRFSKSKKEWEPKVIDDNPVIFNAKMPLDVLLGIISDVAKDYGYNMEFNFGEIGFKF